VSVVFVLQALLLGAGGVTSLPVNAIAVGFVGSAVAAWTFSALRRGNETVALAAAGWLSVVVPAAIVAVALGVQPQIAHRADGTPLFFPFDLAITLPAVLVPHALVGVGEAALTVVAYRFVARYAGARRPEVES
jgi:cobalt/nickel transport system permease protein